MAAYGTLVAWAKAMGHTEAADLLQQTLDEKWQLTRNCLASPKGPSARKPFSGVSDGDSC